MHEGMNALIQRPRKGRYVLTADDQGRGHIVPRDATERGIGTDTGDDTRVVQGSADGGKGRGDASQPTDMNKLLRSRWVASAGTIRVDG